MKRVAIIISAVFLLGLPLSVHSQDDQDLEGLKSLCESYQTAVLSGKAREIKRLFHDRVADVFDETKYLYDLRKVKVLDLRKTEPEVHQGGSWLFATATLETEVQVLEYKKRRVTY